MGGTTKGKSSASSTGSSASSPRKNSMPAEIQERIKHALSTSAEALRLPIRPLKLETLILICKDFAIPAPGTDRQRVERFVDMGLFLPRKGKDIMEGYFYLPVSFFKTETLRSISLDLGVSPRTRKIESIERIREGVEDYEEELEDVEDVEQVAETLSRVPSEASMKRKASTEPEEPEELSRKKKNKEHV
ncbi:hypothetical protein SISSUDRAFT_1044489 [Sistotremastrum suecicum HHB10207 ss-3]|uniref:Uncharacterized protein n=1 Tax=Sistotremastrum suecicum HHB10207 ss-3 TaxID=1314776 RepID=A0A166F3Z8_9AGAM|nr:hypothetical protein SISSUDRAFT_1044489 [Sistotremastrum suecicum HHB10207 ss-3]